MASIDLFIDEVITPFSKKLNDLIEEFERENPGVIVLDREKDKKTFGFAIDVKIIKEWNEKNIK